MTHKSQVLENASTEPAKRLFTMDEAAAYMGMSRSTFFREHKDKLPTVTPNKRPMYDRVDLDKLIEKLKQPAISA